MDADELCEVCGARATRGTLCIACDENWTAYPELTDDEQAAEDATWD